ncbi:MAG: hypothetical protein HY926_00385 [Elusimicrobia bacterium]|nr:hypothetical protein [Elusimicrobiota bacterium]
MGTILRRGTLILLATLASAGCSRLPDGVSRPDLGAETHGHRYHAASGRVLYLQGEYPHKTYFCVYDGLTGAIQKVHVDDYRLIDSDYAYLPREHEAVLPVKFRPSEDAEDHVYVPNATGNLLNVRGPDKKALAADRLLHVSTRDGSIIKEMPLAKDASLAALSRPAWSDRVFIVINAQDKALLKRYDPTKRAAEDAVPLGDFTIQAAAFSDSSPQMILDVRDAAKKPRLVVYDLKAGRISKEASPPAGLDALRASGARFLASYSPSGEVKSIVADIDPQDASVRRIAELDNGIESLALSNDRAWAVSRDASHPQKADDRGFFPRLITLIGRDGSTEPVPWTKRDGELFGYDGRTQRLFFAATQPAGVWTISGDRKTLSAAARELDRTAGEFPRSMKLLLIFMIVGSVVMGVLVRFMKFGGSDI